MTNDSTTTRQLKPTLSTRLLIGAAIGLAVISFFVLSANGGNPEWGRFWMIRPLIVVPAAGAIGGLVSYIMSYLAERNGWNKVLVSIISVLVFIFGIWMGIVLGLVGTMWH
jgi:phage shock protein PspC (stress-responsive transcriptional regulator)